MPVNPITVEVVRNAVNAYADEMATALCKSAYNMMIYEVRDFCCGLIDTQARMISQNKGGLPIFLADLGIAHHPRPDHAAYVASWLQVLKDDPRAIFTAAGKAQQAADWMHARQPQASAQAA